MSIVPFHFLILGAGELIRIYRYVTPEKLQTFIMEDDNFGIRVPLQDCRMALHLMEKAELIRRNVVSGNYERNCT